MNNIRKLLGSAICLFVVLSVSGSRVPGAAADDAQSDGSTAAGPADSAAPASERDKVAAEAERILHNARHTKYEHKAHIDEAAGIYDVDCSRFVSYVLQRVEPDQYSLIPKEDTQPCPRAFKYCEYFTALNGRGTNGWRRIYRLDDARRGDVLAWQFPDIKVDQDTGHVMILAERPKIASDGQLSVRVYDSSVLAHYDDTRDQGDKRITGVGEGTILFKVDDDGHPTAFQFGPGDKFHAYVIAIGRVEDPSASPG
jgi:hypothetical protein